MEAEYYSLYNKYIYIYICIYIYIYIYIYICINSAQASIWHALVLFFIHLIHTSAGKAYCLDYPTPAKVLEFNCLNRL